MDLDLSVSKMYDKRDGFNSEIVNFPYYDGDVPRSPSYGVYISQHITRLNIPHKYKSQKTGKLGNVSYKYYTIIDD